VFAHISTSQINTQVLESVREAAAADAIANHLAQQANSAAPVQTTTVCRICSQAHLNFEDGLCSRCHNPLTAQVATRNAVRSETWRREDYESQRAFAERHSTDSVSVRVHDCSQGNRGQNRSRTPAKLAHDKDIALQTRIRRLGFRTGVDMYNESNWQAKDGSSTAPKPLNWRRNMDAQHLHDREHDRDLPFFQALDSRLASHKVYYKPLTLDERVQRFGDRMSVHPQPGAPPLRLQQNVGPIIEQVVAENHRVRDRSRSREGQWQGSTAWASSAQSSSWRPVDG
jgi:hypothetical protein